MTCTIDDCGRPYIARGWCTLHYQRWQRHGSAEWQPSTPEQRLLASIDKQPGGCWVWTGHRAGTDDAYGVISVDARRVYVHRAAHELWIGPIPDGYQVDHVAARGCRSTLCVNPAHLEAVTPEENIERSSGVAAVNRRKTHCIHGHEFTPENTRVNTKGHRECRACARIKEAKKVGDPEWMAFQAAYRRELRRKQREARAEPA